MFFEPFTSHGRVKGLFTRYPSFTILLGQQGTVSQGWPCIHSRLNTDILVDQYDDNNYIPYCWILN
jgi:hypothetical protein